MSFDLVFFGGTGDLTWRKLMPALFQAFRHGKLPPGGRILTTQLYFRGDPVLDHDSCGPACNTNDPHRIIVLSRLPAGSAGTFDVVLKASGT